MRKRIASILMGALIVFGISVSAETTIEPTVLVDQDGILITATELECEGIKGELKLDIENNSDKDVSIISGSMGFNQNAINNYMTNECYINVDVASGKKAKETITIGSRSNAYMDFTDIASITLAFQVDDDDDTLFYSEPVEIKTSSFDSYDFTDNPFTRGIRDKDIQKSLGYEVKDFKEGELFSLDGLVIHNYAILTKEDKENGVFMEVENTNDSVMVLGVSRLKVNGVDVYYGNWVSKAILPHKKCVIDIDVDAIMENYYGNDVISEIEQVVFTLVSKDSDYKKLNSDELVIIGDEGKYEVDLSGNEIYNANGIQIIAKGIIDNRYGSGDKEFIALVKNENDFEIVLNTDGDFSVNDYMIDTTCYSTNVKEHSVGILYFQLDGDSLEDCDITSFDKVEGSIEIKDDSWNELDVAEISTSF